MTIKEILNNIKYIECINEIDMKIFDVTIDSRVKSDMFIGIKGANNDGSNFFMDAFNNGTKICVIHEEFADESIKEYLINNNKMIIIVDDTLEFLQSLAILKRKQYSIPVIAVTGSAGKTSTKDFIFSVLSTTFKTLKTEGSLNNHLGVPLTILNLRDHECLVIELGMDHMGEISKLSKIVKPTLSVISNVGTSHIGNLGSRENILKAKLEILDGMDEKVLIVNNDNDLLHEYAKNHKVYTLGINNDSNCMCEIIDINGYNSKIKYKDLEIIIPKPGKHNIYNALCGIAVGELLKIDINDIKKGIESSIFTAGRTDIIKSNDYEIISDCYNANTEAMKCALEHLGLFNKRKIAVLGQMGELNDIVEDHKKVGEYVVKNKIDILITVGDESRYINEGAIQNGFNENNSYHFDSKKEAIEFLKKILKKDDIILVKASHIYDFKEIVNALI